MKTQAKLAHVLLALCALILFHSTLARAADAVATVYEDFGHTIKRDAFARGSTVYIGINQAQNDTCYRIEWIDPSGSVVATDDLEGTQNLSGNSDRFDSFFIPLGGPSGIWTARILAFSSGNFNCTGTPTVSGTITFDVARAVIIGAGTTGADTSTTSGGGDNDVFLDQPNFVQGGGTAKKFEVRAGSGNFKRAFVRFDHTGSGISGTVTDAKLRLLMTNAPSSARTYNAHRVTGEWAETSIIWSTQPAVAVSATDSLNTGTGTPSNTLVRWTITADENGFVNNSFNNNGWRISDSEEDIAQVLRGFFGSTEANSSADKTQGPVLLVDYNDLTIICPGNVSPQCASQLPAAATTIAGFLAQGGTIAGGCGDPVTVSSSDAISNQTCANKYTITRTYTVTDACGFSRTCDQTITVNDTMAPVITVAGQAVIEATCYPTAAAALSAILLASSADDNCDGLRPTTVNDGVALDSCHVKFTVSASDTCGNSTSSDVTVKVDDQAPQITIGTLAGCYQSSAAAKAAVEAASGANDDCDGSRPTTVNDGVAVDSCHVKFTVSASDICGNCTSADVTVKVDGQAPQITIGTLAGCYQSSAAAKAAVEAASSANDNCDGSRPTTVNDGVALDSCHVKFTVSASDTCGNSTSSDVTVKVDGQAPQITIGTLAGCYQSSAAAKAAVEAASGANDNCDGSRPTTVNDGVAVDSCHVKFTVSASDTCGNSTSSDVTVKVDGQAPQITIGTLAGCYQNSAAAKAAVEAASSADDNCDGSRPTTVNDGVAVDSCHVKFTVSASDTCGNSTSSEVTVKVDGQAPQITIGTLAGCYQSSAAAKAAVEAASSADDNCDGSRPTTVNDGVAVDSCHVKFTVSASDTCGNSTSSEVTVKVDGQAPQITIGTLAGCYQSSAAAKAAVEAASSANDNCDGNVPATVDNGTPVPNSCNVRFTVSASDACGNPSSTSVTVKVDGTAPVITCPVDKVLTCGDLTTPNVTGFATAADDCDSDPQITYTDLVFGACPTGMTITRTWTVMDACGNSVSCDQIITVTNTHGLTITCPAIANIDCTASTLPANTGTATATGDCSGVASITYSDADAPGTCAGNHIITRTWTAMDACGNSVSCDQTITVTDTHGPTITCPANANIDCTASTLPANTGTATATDDCSNVASITYSDVNAPGTCAGNYTITRTWKATDNCGNFSTCTQTITVTDTTPPLITCPDDIVISTGSACNAVELPDLGTPTVSDDCSGVTVSKIRSDSKGFDDPYPVGTTTIMWTATDACGNNTSCNQKVTVTTDKFIASDFNGTPIAAGRTIWFNSNAKVKLRGNCPVTIRFLEQTIRSAKFNLAIPDSVINFVEGACPATTIFDDGKWVTTVGCDFTGPVFLSGYAFQVPAEGLPGGIKPVTWSGTFTTDTPGVTLQWSWGAAVYTTFAPDNNSIGVKPVDGKKCTSYLNSDHAGTPENYKPYVIGGARGGGGSNWTGVLSGTQAVAPCDALAMAAAGKLEGTDVAPLFEALHSDGDTTVVADLRQAANQCFYTAPKKIQTRDEINWRMALIDELEAVSSDPAARNALQHERDLPGRRRKR